MIGPAAADPMFPNSIVSNDIDFIAEDDPEAGFCLQFAGTTRAEMPDKRNDILFVEDVLVFRVVFAEGDVEVWVHPDVGGRAKAEALIDPVIRSVARLPQPMRALLNHVVVHDGKETAFAEDLGRFFVMYSENIRERVSMNDISETVFHEAVHATLDVPHSSSDAWISAQHADGSFVTSYAAEFPGQEDLAESTLFAWTVLKHPGRLTPAIEANVRGLMPNRLAFFETLFDKWEPPSPTDAAPKC